MYFNSRLSENKVQPHTTFFRRWRPIRAHFFV
nr:MAG TPA: hypothetical protein [Caudoviricetes sp.]